MEKLYVIKIGGNVIDDEVSFHDFLKSFAGIAGKKILVHGGGKIATQIGNQLGIESKYVDGRRVTDSQTIDLVTMVYGGLINKKAVSILQSLGCNALGVTGADAGLLPAVKRPVKEIDYGWVGDVDVKQIPTSRWTGLVNMGIVPVVAPLTHDGQGHILNTNADTIASAIAQSLAGEFEVSLIYCFEKKGVLEDVNDENSFLINLDEQLYKQLKEEDKLFAGILPKLQNAFEAKRTGVEKVLIGSSEELNLLIEGKSGTIIGG